MSRRKYVRYATKEKLDKVCQENKWHIQKFFSFKNMNISESTRVSYESDFNQFLVFVHDKYKSGAIFTEDIVKIVKDEDGSEEMVDLIEDYIAFCASVLGNNERRIQRRLSSISSFYLYLMKKRRIKANPVDFLERPSVRNGEKLQIKQTFLTKEQVLEIRRGLEIINNLQLKIYFEIGLSTMARVNAISNIKIKQIDFNNKRIVDVLEKEGKVVTLFPSDRALNLIKELLDVRKNEGINSEYLFITKGKDGYNKVSKSTIQSVWIKKIGSIIGVPELHSHDLRHSGSNLLYHSGMSLEDVSILLNHESTDTTKAHYLQVNYENIQNKKSSLEV